MQRLAIVCTHPIQYYAPVFRLLAENGKVLLRVFYTWGNTAQEQYDPGFGKKIIWDVPLLEGYDYIFVPNTSKQPGSHHFSGIVNPSLTKQVMDWQPNAVLVYGWNYHSHLRLMWHLKGKIPVWFRGDSNLLDPTPRWKALLKKQVLRLVYKLVDLAFYVGSENKRYYLAYGLKEEQLIFAPHAIDNQRFEDSPENSYEEKAKKWRAELGLNGEDRVLLFAGKFEPKKAPLQLLKAVQYHNQHRENKLKLILVGNGILEQELKALAENDPYVQFLAFQNQSKMPIVYRLGDAFCLPSLGPGETWGLAINEAMACGKVAIVSDKVGCHPDLVQEGRTGFVFNANDFSNLSDTLETLGSMSADALAQMGVDAKEKIQKWNFAATVSAFESKLLP